MAQRPTIDHGVLSPSGRVSKRARKAALERETAKLFPDRFWDDVHSDEQAKQKVIDAHRQAASQLRELAARGMSPRKHTREAARLEQLAADLEAQS
jgi:hypothetical protein